MHACIKCTFSRGCNLKVRIKSSRISVIQVKWVLVHDIWESMSRKKEEIEHWVDSPYLLVLAFKKGAPKLIFNLELKKKIQRNKGKWERKEEKKETRKEERKEN